MKKICLVTYTRANELFTKELLEICQILKNAYCDFKCVVFSDSNSPVQIEVDFVIDIIDMKGTKYKKICFLMENDDSDYFLSIDNDMTANMVNLKEFVDQIIHNNFDIGWGRIRLTSNDTFVSKLVEIDKLISHYLIRPALWHLGLGISIPGQCFMLKREKFAGELLEIDTFLDDLALGLYVNEHRKELKINYSEKILGYEKPNETFKGLWIQRGRWANGFSTIIHGVNDPFLKKLVWIHALSYHFLWIIDWIVLLSLFYILPAAMFFYLFLISVIIARGNYTLFIYAIMYRFIFPIFHIRWMWCLRRT